MSTESLWSSLLTTTSKISRPSTAVVLLLGPNSQCQTTFIRHLQVPIPDDLRESTANQFAMGYSFIDYKDDHDYNLSRIEIYTLDTPSSVEYHAHAMLVRQVITKSQNGNIPVLITIGLDGSDDIKHKWTRQLTQWLDIIKTATKELDLQIPSQTLKKHLQQYVSTSSDSSTSVLNEIEVPLAQGQYDSPLGVNLLLAPIGAEHLIQDYGSSLDDSLDLAQQILRVIALKHGGSVAYISKTESEALLSLVSETLELPVKSAKPEKSVPSVLDTEMISIPAGWDSKGKITAIHGGFPYEEFSRIWDSNDSSKIQSFLQSLFPDTAESNSMSHASKSQFVSKPDFQAFLSEQYNMQEKKIAGHKDVDGDEPAIPEDLSNINITGIKVEGVDEVLRRLKAREQATATSQPAVGNSADESMDQSAKSAANTSNQNEVLANFFQSLLDRKKTPESGSSAK